MATWSELKIKLITTGDETGSWGESTNANLGTAIEQAITGTADVTFTDADVHLYLTDSTDLQNARALRLTLIGSVSTHKNLYVPNIQKFYIIDNELAEAITVQNETGTGAALTIPAGRSTFVFNTSTNIVNPNTYFAGAVLSDAAVILGGAINDTSIGALSASTGEFTTLTASSATLSSPLPVTSGGSGVSTSTGTGSVVLSSSPSLTTPSMSDPTMTGIPTAPTADPGTNTTQVATTAFTLGAVDDLANTLGTMAVQDADAVSITGGTITGITDLTVADGGTGSSSLAANNVLLGNGTSALQVVAPSTSGNILTSDGTTWTSTAKIGYITPVTLSGASTVLTTSIPATAKRITLLFNGVGSTGAVDWSIQIGTSSGLETTGYSYASSTAAGGTLGGQAAISTTGYFIRNNNSAVPSTGFYTLTLMNPSTNMWLGNGQIIESFGGNGTLNTSLGVKTLGGALTRISILCGVSTWSSGSISLIYE